MRCAALGAALFLALTACASTNTSGTPPARPKPSSAPSTATVGVVRIQSDAVLMEPFVKSDFAREFVRSTKALPHEKTRVLYRDKAAGKWYSDRDSSMRAGLEPVRFDEELFYNPPHYGGVLAYARPFDLLGEAWAKEGGSAPKSAAGLRILDFGYGAIGHLRALASIGADAVGVEVDPLLPVLYAGVSDKGIALIDGRYPADRETKQKAGAGYDLIIAKNTLKKGYVHPDQP